MTAWNILQKTVDLDAPFEGHRDGKYSELGFTIEGLRGAMRMSKGFIFTTEGKIALGLKEESRGNYSYVAFKHDMIEEFGFGQDQHRNTPIHQVSRAGARSRLNEALTAKHGEEKAAEIQKVFNIYFVEVVGAAIFAHAEASMQLAMIGREEVFPRSGRRSD